MSSVSEKNKRLTNSIVNLNCLFEEVNELQSASDIAFLSQSYFDFFQKLQSTNLEEVKKRLEALEAFAAIGKRIVTAETLRRTHQQSVNSAEVREKARENFKTRKRKRLSSTVVNPFKTDYSAASDKNGPNMRSGSLDHPMDY